MRSHRLTTTSIRPWLASLASTALLLGLEGCQTVTLPDTAVYAIKSGGAALEAHTLSAGMTRLTPSQWSAVAPGKLCISIDDFAAYKKILEKLCAFNPGTCVSSTSDQLHAVLNKIQKAGTEAHY